jgi:homoserine dehydrogenase
MKTFSQASGVDVQKVVDVQKKETLNVAIVGFGTVGSSVAKILSSHPAPGLRLTHVYNRGVARKKVDWLHGITWTEDINDVLCADVDILVEVVGGLNPAGDWIRKALSSGKSVVTANKQLIAHHGPELIALAKESGRHIAFGASVAGGVPVISGLQEGLAGDELSKIYGILNGTCNYILSQIDKRGISFTEALAEAQKLGFAEADPTDDVDGYDARAKLTILARVGLHSDGKPEKVLCRSIRPIEAIDFVYARQLQSTIRQVSWAELIGENLLAAVQPAIVAESSPLASVEGGRNLVMSTGKFGGEIIFAGHGAGGNPTAVAVVSDILAIARAKHGGSNGLAEITAVPRSVINDYTSRHYLRFIVKDRPGIIATIATILSKNDINIDSVLQKPGYSDASLPFVITLESCKSSLVEKALEQMSKLDFMVQPCVHLPIL